MNLYTQNDKRVIIVPLLVALLMVVFGVSVSIAQTYQVKPGVNLNARSGPGTTFSSVGKVTPDATLEELQRKGDWSEVKNNDGKRFWVHNGFLSKAENSHISSKQNNVLDNVGDQISIFPNIGHSNNVVATAISPNNKFVLTGSADGTVILWDALTGKSIRSFLVLYGTVRSVAFSPDSKKLLTAANSFVKIWRVKDGKHLQTFNAKGWVFSALFSSDGQQIFAVSGKNIIVWDTKAQKLTKTFQGHTKSVNSISLSLAGDMLVSGANDGTARIWDVDSSRLIRTFIGHKGPVLSVSISNDQSIVVTGSEDKSVRIWTSANGEVQHTLTKHTNAVNSVAISPDGVLILSSSKDKNTFVWSLRDRKYLGSLSGHEEGITSISIAPDGKTAISGSIDDSAILWDLDSLQPKNYLSSHLSHVLSVSASRQPNVVATGSGDGKIRFWDLSKGKIYQTLHEHSESINSVAFSSTKDRIVTGSSDRTVRYWDSSDGKLLNTLFGIPRRALNVTFSPDGNRVLIVAESSSIIWSPKKGEVLHRFKGNSPSQRFGSFSPDGKLVVIAPSHRQIDIYGVESGDLVSVLEVPVGAQVKDAVFSPNSKIVMPAFDDGIVQTYNTNNGQLLDSWQDIYSGIRSIRYSPDGKIFVTGSRFSNASIWDSSKGQVLLRLSGHRSDVSATEFIQKGEVLVTASLDGTTRLWDVATGKERAQMISFTDGEWVIMTPEGFFNASLGGAKYLNVIRGLDLISIDHVYDVLFRPDLVKEALAGDRDGKVKAAAEKLDLKKVIASGLSPRIRVISPVAVNLGDAKPEPVVAAGDIVEVEIEFKDNGGGIGRVEWRVNGTTQGEVTDRGFERIATNIDVGKNNAAADNKPRSIRLKQKLFLSSGNNEISVVAYNHANLIASEPIGFTLTLEGAKAGNPKLYVLAVGVDDYYDSRLKLNYAVSDVNAIGQAMTKAGKDLYEEVIIKTVLDKEVTKEGLETAFEELSSQINADDVFVFFLAGHGKTLDGRYYFLPRDFRYQGEDSIRTAGIGQKLWQSWFARLKAQKSVLLYDTCESGTLTGDQTLRGLENVAAIDRLTRATGRTTLTAATDTAPALEGYRGHGLFTYAILDALANSDGDNDKQIEVTELATYIDKYLPQVSEAAFGYRQIPQMSIRGNSFPLVRPTNVLADEGQPDKQPLKISKVPTHVVIKSAQLFETPDGVQITTTPLKPGTLVTLMKTDSGWTLIAKGGRKLGYIADNNLIAAQ